MIAFKQFYSNSKAFTLGAFWFTKLCVDFRHFQVFIFCHTAYSKTQKPWKIFRSSVLEVLSLIICFEHFAKHFVCSRQNSQGVAQSYQGALTIEAWNWLFLLLRSKWYVDNKLIAFWFRNLCVYFRSFRVFIFYHRAYSKTRNPRKILFLHCLITWDFS